MNDVILRHNTNKVSKVTRIIVYIILCFLVIIALTVLKLHSGGLPKPPPPPPVREGSKKPGLNRVNVHFQMRFTIT